MVGFSDADDAPLPWMDTGGDVRCVGNWKDCGQLSRGVDIRAAYLGVGCTVVRVGTSTDGSRSYAQFCKWNAQVAYAAHDNVATELGMQTARTLEGTVRARLYTSC